MATRPIASSFEEFEREALLLATIAPGSITAESKAGICADAQTRIRFGTSDLLGLLVELKRWCLALAAEGEGNRDAGKAPALMDSLLRAAAGNRCVYWMPPAAISTTKPVVLIRSTVLAEQGRLAVLRAIWEHERSQALAAVGDEGPGELNAPQATDDQDIPQG